MEVGLDQLNIAEILPDDGSSDLDRLLDNITASVESTDSLRLDLTTVSGGNPSGTQGIVLENVDVAGLGLEAGSSSADIINQLFTSNVFIVD
ncbi:type I secretion C-terminal target domain-containing protein [Photobacterium japonica]